MKQFFFYVGMLCMLVPISGISQSKEDEKYRKESEDLRKQIWALNKEQFKVKDVPAEYNNQSKVILAHHTELTADSKSKVGFYGLAITQNKEQKIVEIVREMIKLNDKSAVDEYSELSFTKFQASSGFGGFERLTTYVGVRVIKQDGKIQEVNADDVVLTKDAGNEKIAKLAIPDLQPGDIIDYYFTSTQQLSNSATEKNYRIILFDDAPMLSYSFHAALGKKYVVEYRSYNGAPNLKVKKDAEESIIIDIDKQNIPPVETTLWVALAQQLPFIRLNISLGLKGKEGDKMGIGKPGEIIENKDHEAVINEKSSDLSIDYYLEYLLNRPQFNLVVDAAKKNAKQLGIDYKDMGDEEKLALIYYTFRYTNLLNFDINNLARSINSSGFEFNGLGFVLFCAAKAGGLEPTIIVAPPRTGFRLNEIMDKSDVALYAYLPSNKNFFYMNSIYDVPFIVPPDFDGVSKTFSMTFRHPRMMAGDVKYKLVEKSDGVAVTASTAEKNAHIENLTVSIAPNLSNLSVNRKTVVKGYFKVDLQRQLILYEDFYEYERKAMMDEKSLFETLEDNKKGKKYVDEVRSAFAEARKKQKDAFTDEAKNWFSQDISEMKDYKVENLGVRHTAPDFIYSSNFSMSGMVKKAGNNLIVEIGKILGEQLIIKEVQRKRDLDVFMPFARSIENNIVFNIPDGYTVEGVNELNRNIDNATGLFKVEASISGKQIIIKVKKQYLHNYESKENWDKQLAFLDAANDWLGTKLLFKKV